MRVLKIEEPFKWRQNGGQHIRVTDMDVNHLWNTLRMAWNHSVPEDLKVFGRYRKYNFGPDYTDEYMRKAIVAIHKELITRDLTPKMLNDLNRMRILYIKTYGNREEYLDEHKTGQMMSNINVLSLFDGMSCGQVALSRANISIDKYYASEIDKYAVNIAMKNHPNTIQLGDISGWRDWDLDWSSIDLIIAGSPCQGFSLAGKQKAFDDPRSKLFFIFVDILNYVKKHNPNIKFLLENVKMKKEHINTISNHLGVKPVLINSALVSAQHRQRLYWANWHFEQPEDEGIFLKDILQFSLPSCNVGLAVKNKAGEGGSVKIKNHFNKCVEQEKPYIKADKKLNIKNNQNKASCLTGGANSGGNHSDMDIMVIRRPYDRKVKQMSKDQLHDVGRASDFKGTDMIKRVYSPEGKCPTITALTGGHQHKKVSIDDEFYRRLTPIECERLQTLPDNYTLGVSNTQRYKMLGNGWTVDIISHILSNLETTVKTKVEDLL